jgi:adenylate cyclase
MRRSRRERWLVGFGSTILVGATLSAAFLLGLFATLQLQSTDFSYRASGGQSARATTIVGIDQRSYRELLPRYGTLVEWPRTVYARALEALRAAGPRVVVLDLFFDAPRPGDDELADAMRRLGNVLTPVEAQGPDLLDPRPGVAQRFDAFVRPTEAVRSAAAGEGLVNITTDPDSVVRGLPLLLTTGDRDLPALALATVAQYARRPRVLDAPPSPGRVYGAGRAVPVVEADRMLINFLGPPSSPERGGAFPIVPFVDLLEGRLDRSLVEDRIVLLGLTIRGIDEFATPTTGVTRMWGVEVLGSAVETILTQRYLAPAPAALTVALIFSLAALAVLLALLRRPLFAGLGVAALLGLYLLAAMVAVDNGLVLNLVFPPAALLLAFGLALAGRVVLEQAEQRLLRDVMARYLSPAVSRWVLRDADRLRLGGETRTMTVLFSDLRGFTTLSHRLEPQVLVGLLNEYMTAMTEVVFRHDGVLDKYIGDAIMAFWNAPLEQPDHARLACDTALDMIERLGTLQSDWQARGLPRLELGIGLNTGPMVVGNMGSRQRLAYTVLGDAVNVAARLEGLSKEYGTRIVIGEATRAAAGDRFVYRPLDVVAVRGRDEPIAVHEIVGRAGQVSQAALELLADYERAVGLYRQRSWREAGAIFERLLQRVPNDGPTALYLRRCAALQAQPPPADWSGVDAVRL